MPTENLKQLRAKIRILVRNLDGKANTDAIDIIQQANHWLNVDSKSHWSKMKKGEDVSKDISQIKEKGNEIVLHYNLTFGDSGYL